MNSAVAQRGKAADARWKQNAAAEIEGEAWDANRCGYTMTSSADVARSQQLRTFCEQSAVPCAASASMRIPDMRAPWDLKHRTADQVKRGNMSGPLAGLASSTSAT